MKKICCASITLLLLFIFNIAVYADVTFDTSETSKGLLSITYDGSLSKMIKVTVEKAGSSDKYTYSVNSNQKFSVPLQIGDGKYTVKLLQNISGASYRVLENKSIDVKVTSPNDMFLKASPIVNYSADMEAIKGYDKTISGFRNEIINGIYERVVNDYYYDYDKAASALSEYVPVIDEIYKSKKGICYDYSVMLSSVLRHKGIPSKLVMGYAPEVEGYHAWNEILMDGAWIVVDTTYDSAYAHAGYSYIMKKDASLFKITKVY